MKESITLDYKKAKRFFHCKNCIEQFLGSELHQSMTPSDYGLYEASTYAFKQPDGSEPDILVLWCKRCKRSVWDSRLMSGPITH
jgi:hypothetical protein